MEPSGTARGDRPDPALTEALHGALDTLQAMIERRQGEASQAAGGLGGDDPATDPEDLPVLREVVVPGHEVGLAPPGPAAQAARRPAATSAGPAGSSPEPPPAARLPSHEDLLRRLVSEAEVIIEDAVAEAMTQARKEVRARLRRHLQIVLPEVLQELLQRAAAPRGGTRSER